MSDSVAVRPERPGDGTWAVRDGGDGESLLITLHALPKGTVTSMVVRSDGIGSTKRDIGGLALGVDYRIPATPGAQWLQIRAENGATKPSPWSPPKTVELAPAPGSTTGISPCDGEPQSELIPGSVVDPDAPVWPCQCAHPEPVPIPVSEAVTLTAGEQQEILLGSDALVTSVS